MRWHITWNLIRVYTVWYCKCLIEQNLGQRLHHGDSEWLKLCWSDIQDGHHTADIFKFHKLHLLLNHISDLTVCKGKEDLQTKNTIFFENYNLTTLDIPSLLHQTRRNNSLFLHGNLLHEAV